MPGNTAYCLSKGGMRMLTRTAGVELAPHNILVVGVGPRAMASRDQPLHHAESRAAPKKLNAAIPLGHLARPEKSPAWWRFSPGTGPVT